MIWVDREVKKIKERGLKMEWVDDMKTPSGRIHVGSLWGITIHDLIYKVLLENEVETHFSYVFNDMDPMDAIPSYLHYAQWQKHEGEPLYKVPPPEPGFKSFAEYYAKEFMETFNKLNCFPEIIWSHELYESGKMNDVIKIILDNTKAVKEIYKDVAKAHQPENWYPFQPICENCGKIGTTETYDWDGKHVYYHCKPHKVKWAKGCDHKGKIIPFNGTGKLLWKCDWPAHWKIIGVTVEGSGKDHMSSGGSYDFASQVMKRIFKTDPPYAVGYEWFTIGGKKMSSSKGIGTSAKDIAALVPPELLRFLMVRTPISSHLDFDPTKPDTIPNLFDDYDRCLDAYYLKKENKLPEKKQGEVLSDFARIMELSEVKPFPEERFYIPRFRTIVNLVKTNADIETYAIKQKGSNLNDVEKDWLEERVVYAEKYLADTALYHKLEKHEHTHISFTSEQVTFLGSLKNKLQGAKNPSQEEIKTIILAAIKSSQLAPREAFQSLYLALTGKPSGPHASELIAGLGIPKTIVHLENALIKTHTPNHTNSSQIKIFNRPEIFSIHPEVREKFPSVSVGVAIIKNVTIQKTPPTLQKEIDSFVETLSTMTTEELGMEPEVKSYRKLYKEMGIDWHSRRPSPEALLRRVVLKKGLYSINSCVDAYNLVVMKNKVSVGAFDLDKIKLPTVLRFPKNGEEILLLGDTKPTAYTEKELSYFDAGGGYNIDFNYRDSQRTAVSETAKNVFINVDGVYDISKEQVQKTLDEAVANIIKYCGGTVEVSGVVSSS